MSFTLSGVVPWGRSYNEYVAMFSLSAVDLRQRILGCADGPSAFNLTVCSPPKGARSSPLIRCTAVRPRKSEKGSQRPLLSCLRRPEKIKVNSDGKISPPWRNWGESAWPPWKNFWQILIKARLKAGIEGEVFPISPFITGNSTWRYARTSSFSIAVSYLNNFISMQSGNYAASPHRSGFSPYWSLAQKSPDTWRQ